MLTTVIILDPLWFAQFSYYSRVNVDQLAPLGSSPPWQVTEIRFIPSWTPAPCGSSLPVTLGKENVDRHLGKSRDQSWKCRISFPSVFHGLIRDSRRDGGWMLCPCVPRGKTKSLGQYLAVFLPYLPISRLSSNSVFHTCYCLLRYSSWRPNEPFIIYQTMLFIGIYVI